MKQFLLILILPIVFILSACDDKADPLRNESPDVQASDVMEQKEKPLPGIHPEAMQISLVRNLDVLYFEENREFAYEVNVRLFLPDLDFDAELVGAPDGMTLELKSEFNSEVVTSPVDTDTETETADDEDTDKDKDTTVEPPKSVANQKIYIIRWKPSLDTIPDVTIQSISRFVSFQVNIDGNKQRTKEFRYTVNQAIAQLKVTGFTIDPDLREGEKRGKAKIYVSYPGIQSTTKYPGVFIETKGNSPTAACVNMPNVFSFDSARYISDANDPNYESIEYNYTIDLTNFKVDANSVSCNLDIYVMNLGSRSDAYPISVTVLNTITDPETNWSENINLEFDQEKETAFYFTVYGAPNEGVISVDFKTPCSQIFDRQGDCKCRKFSAFTERHKVECLIEVNHKKTFGKQTYQIEYSAIVNNGTGATASSSRRVTFKRSITFRPNKGLSFWDADTVTDTDTDTDLDATDTKKTLDDQKPQSKIQ